MPDSLQWHIGCSGFHYEDWRGIFYPAGLPKSKWFAHYCQHFDTLELNVTFYRFPQIQFLKNWFNISPQNFSFSVKAPRLITHYKQFNDCERLLGDFYKTTREGLREKLGCILFQLPSRTTYSEEKLDQIIRHVDPSFRNVIEFRHSSWWKKRVYKKLADHGLIFCGHSHPELPEDVVINSELVYYRFHGIPVIYYSQYKRHYIEEITDQLKVSKIAGTAYIYFNNTATMGAIRNAVYMKKLTDGLVVRG